MPSIHIDLSQQTLTLRAGDRSVVYQVSTGANGPGEQTGSGCTPRGQHRVRLKIGANCPVGAVFRGRRWTGEVYSPALGVAQPQRDWILTRILWLTGTERGRNRGGNVDTLRRFIYIHGCPPTEPMGVPRSHGCIRMRDADLVALFDAVGVGTPVDIC
ncbi:L,D-transpeptidase [Thiohalocapsa sp.]|uniref:L,D-transpeptidase n=1 Tax=Thiohalocapsa sp. TaxID=2497641 RepID=UPI0026001A7B|nr:L,D-transpeptidase [Thiohalocapsa sp.]